MTTPTVMSQSARSRQRRPRPSSAWPPTIRKKYLPHTDPPCCNSAGTLHVSSLPLIQVSCRWRQTTPRGGRRTGEQARSTAVSSSRPSRYCCSMYSSKTASPPARRAAGSRIAIAKSAGCAAAGLPDARRSRGRVMDRPSGAIMRKSGASDRFASGEINRAGAIAEPGDEKVVQRASTSRRASSASGTAFMRQPR